MGPLLGKVERLKIKAFKKDTRKGSKEEFVFLINPGEIVTRHDNRFHQTRGINTSGRSALYSYAHSDQLSVQLVADNTFNRQSLSSSKTKNIREKVEAFLSSCFYMDGDIHEPRFLLLEWGKFNFECRLKSVNVTYSQFDEKGIPQRAILETLFVEDLPAKKRIKLENKKSPDITHGRTLLQGDRLPALSKDIYGDAAYYIKVAAANKLDHFRKLKPGSTLKFPPLEK